MNIKKLIFNIYHREIIINDNCENVNLYKLIPVFDKIFLRKASTYTMQGEEPQEQSVSR